MNRLERFNCPQCGSDNTYYYESVESRRKVLGVDGDGTIILSGHDEISYEGADEGGWFCGCGYSWAFQPEQNTDIETAS